MKIGLVDDTLKKSHANTFLRIFREQHHDDVRVVAAWGLQEESSMEWCVNNAVEWVSSAEKVAEVSDVVVILAPDNVNVHYDLAKRIFPLCDRVFIDKPLAPSINIANDILALAKETGTSFFSSSALRFSPDLVAYKHARAKPETDIGQLEEAVDVEVKGPGTWPGYAVHVVETAVALFGADVDRLRTSPAQEEDEGKDKLWRVELRWKDGKTALLTVNGWAPSVFQAVVTHPSRLIPIDMNNKAYYYGLVAEMVRFFQTAEPSFPMEETLAVVNILESAIASRKSGDWIDL